MHSDNNLSPSIYRSCLFKFECHPTRYVRLRDHIYVKCFTIAPHTCLAYLALIPCPNLVANHVNLRPIRPRFSLLCWVACLSSPSQNGHCNVPPLTSHIQIHSLHRTSLQSGHELNPPPLLLLFSSLPQLVHAGMLT